MNKAHEDINWQDLPIRNTPLAARNLNKMDHSIDVIDDRVIALDSDKVSKEAGKGLSSNDYTTAEKTKLTGIETGATAVSISDTLQDGDTIANITINGTTTAIKAKQPNESEMNVRSAMLLLSPTPIGENAPFVKRISGGNVPFPALLKDKIIGASIVWNQLVKNGNFASNSNWILNNKWTIASNKASATYNPGDSSELLLLDNLSRTDYCIANHVYMITANINSPNASRIRPTGTTSDGSFAIPAMNGTTHLFWKPSVSKVLRFDFDIRDVESITSSITASITNYMCFDLTAMFGSAIADYVNTLETQTAGSGIAWLKSYGFFTEPYYAYSANTIQSVSVSAKKYVGKNLLPMTVASIKSANTSGTWSGNAYTVSGITFTVETGSDGNVNGIKATGTTSGDSTFFCYGSSVSSSDDIVLSSPFIGSTNVVGSASSVRGIVWGTNGNYIDGTETSFNAMTVYGFGLRVMNGYAIPSGGLTFKPMIRLSTEADGTFAPYTETTYSLDHTTLRGLFKLDANNNLYADGDIYPSSGSGSVVMGEIDLGDYTWTYDSTNQRFYTNVDDIKRAESRLVQMLCPLYECKCNGETFSSSWDMVVYNWGGNYKTRVAIHNHTYTDATTFKTAMSGVKLIYPLETPTTQNLTPYPDLQNIASGGTEEFVDYQVSQDNRDVSIPVGGERQYYQGMDLPALPTASGNHNLQFNPSSGFSWS